MIVLFKLFLVSGDKSNKPPYRITLTAGLSVVLLGMLTRHSLVSVLSLKQCAAVRRCLELRRVPAQ